MQESCWPQRAIHLDFHTMPQVYDVGVDFDAQAFARTLQEAHVDYITVFARCNLGMAFYPTKVGTVHPGLQRELLGPMVQACHRHDIKVAAYINVGIDHEHALRHREWCKLNAKGQVYEVDRMGHSFRSLCLNTGYRQHVLDMIAEIFDLYPVDGIFLDCFSLAPCYGVECLDAMRALGIDSRDEEQVQAYAWTMTQGFIREVEALVAQEGRAINICYNGLPYANQPTHLELEILPTSFWGYDTLPWAIRYARTLNKPFFTMTGRFHEGWGDFGGLRPYHSLLYDCYNSIANAGTCSIGDHMHPRGKLDVPVYDLVERVFERVEQLEPWTEGARAVAEIAVVEPGMKGYPGLPFERASVIGAARMLMELKCQFDVCSGEGDLSPYRLLILPDHVRLDDELGPKVQAHLDRGGAVISSAYSGLAAERDAFALEAYALDYLGPEAGDPTYFEANPEVGAGLPDMPTTIYDPGIAMQAQPGAATLARLIKPYFNYREWDWYHENMYTPPEGDSGRPALVQSGPVIHFSFPIFAGYYEHAVLAYKRLLGNCMARLLPEPLLQVENMPSFGQATLTARDNLRLVHLLTYVPELRGRKIQVIEEPVTVSGVSVALRLDEREVSCAYLAPGRQPLPLQREARYVWVTIPEVVGYQMVVFELAS